MGGQIKINTQESRIFMFNSVILAVFAIITFTAAYGFH